MCFVPDHTFQSWVSEQEHVIVYLVVERLLVNVMFTVFGIAGLFKGESLHAHICSIDDDSFVQGSSGDYVFHASDELKLVFVQLLNMADCGGTVGGLLVVFL